MLEGRTPRASGCTRLPRAVGALTDRWFNQSTSELRRCHRGCRRHRRRHPRGLRDSVVVVVKLTRKGVSVVLLQTSPCRPSLSSSLSVAIPDTVVVMVVAVLTGCTVGFVNIQDVVVVVVSVIGVVEAIVVVVS